MCGVARNSSPSPSPPNLVVRDVNPLRTVADSPTSYHVVRVNREDASMSMARPSSFMPVTTQHPQVMLRRGVSERGEYVPLYPNAPSTHDRGVHSQPRLLVLVCDSKITRVSLENH